MAQIGVQQQFVETVGLLSMGGVLDLGVIALLHEMNLAVEDGGRGFGRGDPARGKQPVSDLPRPF